MENLEQSVEQTSEESIMLEQAYADAKAMQEESNLPEEVEEESTVEEDLSESEEIVPGENKLDNLFSEPIILKDRKLEIPVNNMDELISLAQKGLNYTQKTQQLSSQKNTVDYLGKHNINMEDLEALAAIKNGDKEAIGYLAKNNKIDIYDVDSTATFNPSDNVKYYEPTDVDLVAQDILQNEQVSQQITEWVSNDVLPNEFLGLLRTDARALQAFAEDVDSGIAQRILPVAVKNYAINKGNFLDSYIGAARYLQAQVVPEVKNASTSDKAKVSISSGRQSSATIDDDGDIYENNISNAELMRRIQIQADKLRNSKG